MKLPRWFHRFGSPPYIYSLAGLLGPWVGGIAVVLMVVSFNFVGDGLRDAMDPRLRNIG